MSAALDRRHFARALAAGAAGLATGLAGGEAQTAAAEPAVTGPSGDKAAPRVASPVDLAMEQIKLRYPNGLTEENLAEIRRQVEGLMKRSERLRGFPLTNADGPAFVFGAYRGETEARVRD